MPPQTSKSAAEMNSDIEDLHQQAIQQGQLTYKDPATGFTAFTELAHLKRGVCCGSQCRHCPYGWKNVKSGTTREAKVQSGNIEATQTMIEAIATANDKKGRGGRHGGTHTTKNVPYTRGGDNGTSQLSTGERRSKMDEAFEAMGTVDELCSTTGVVHAELTMEHSDTNYGDMPEWLLEVMSRLFDIGSHVAKPRRMACDDNDDEDAQGTVSFVPDGIGGGFDERHIDELEYWIDAMTEDLPELYSFVLPTGGRAAAQLHVCRTVCRRAERTVVGLVTKNVCDPNASKYLNRLSDFFFTAARWTNFKEGRTEIQYRRAQRGDKQRSRTEVILKHEHENAK